MDSESDIEYASQSSYDEDAYSQSTATDGGITYRRYFPERKKRLCEGTVTGATFNLTNVAVGASMLAFPYVFSVCGVFLALILLGSLAALMGYIGHLIANICHKIHAEAPEYPLSYENILDLRFGRKVTIIVVFCVMINLFASLLALTIIVGDTLQPVVYQITAYITDPNDTWWTTSYFISAILGLFVVLPLCMVTKIDGLRWTSGIAIFSLFLTFGVVIYFAMLYWFDDDYDSSVDEALRGTIHFFVWKWRVFEVIPIITFSLSCHIQMPVIYNDLSNASVKKFDFVILCTFILSVTLYGGVGIFGYSEFGDTTTDNILLNYPSKNLLVNFARICITIMAVTSYPLMNFVCRSVIDYLIESLIDTFRTGCKKPNQTGARFALAKSGPTFYLRIFVINCILFLTAWLLSILVPGIQVVFSLAGATMVTITTFIVPAALHWSIYKHRIFYGPIQAAVIIAFGVFIGVIGTAATVYDIELLEQNK